MKKYLGIVFALVLTLVLTLAMAVPAMADEGGTVGVDSYVCNCTEVIICEVVDPSGGSISFGEVTPGVKAVSNQSITVTNISTNNAFGHANCLDCAIPDIEVTASIEAGDGGGDAHYAANLYRTQYLDGSNRVDGASITVASGDTNPLAQNVTFDVPDSLPAAEYTGTITITCEGA